MSPENLNKQLVKYAPNMPLSVANEILEEFKEMREELSKAQYSIIVALEMMGFDTNCNPPKDLVVDTKEKEFAIKTLSMIHAGAAVGIPGLEACMKSWREKYNTKP